MPRLCVTALLLLGLSGAVFAAEPPRSKAGIRGAEPKQIAPSGYKASISNKRAASLVKKRYSSVRILGVSLMDEVNPPIYRVRTLSENGVVKSIFVDGKSGEVFE